MIADEAVEVLARVLANEALFNADVDGYGWDAETDSSNRFMPSARTKARRYLEAAAPHMKADVERDAYNRGWGAGFRHARAAMERINEHYNPYRSQA